MDQETYRKAVENLSFSADFPERTKQFLRENIRPERTGGLSLEAVRSAEQERLKMKKGMKLSVTIAAAVAAMVLVVSAAALWLTPAQVAQELDEPELAEAFKTAKIKVQSATVGDYDITFEGIVSGERLAARGIFTDGEISNNRTYAVFAVTGKDGTPLSDSNQTLHELGLTITPLVAGYAPWQINLWTLGGAYEAFGREGVAYFLLSMDTLEQFADEDVYFAVYDADGNFPPSTEIFVPDGDGMFVFRDGVQGATFTLPDN